MANTVHSQYNVQQVYKMLTIQMTKYIQDSNIINSRILEKCGKVR